VSWHSKLQKCVALSATEAEYIATIEVGKEMPWRKWFHQELELKQKEYVVFCDSQSGINMTKNSMYHSYTKHIDVRYHSLRSVTEEKLMMLNKIHTDRNVTDMLTKVIPSGKFDLCT